MSIMKSITTIFLSVLVGLFTVLFVSPNKIVKVKSIKTQKKTKPAEKEGLFI